MFKLINGDCLEVMQSLIDDGVKVDMILTDPPYLINYHTGWRSDKTHKLAQPILNDNNPQLIKDIVPLCYELLNDGATFYCFCSEHYIDYFKQVIQEYFTIKNILIWVKRKGGGLGDLKGSYASCNEFIIFATKGRHLLNGGRDPNILYYNKVPNQNLLHSNQKPINLLEYIIGKSTDYNDLILDCFMGSGSTGVACLNTNRQFIGIELDKDYYQIAQERCKNYQTKLEV